MQSIPKTSLSSCPYGADDCPKVEDLASIIAKMEKRILRIEQILYVICGILACELGYVII